MNIIASDKGEKIEDNILQCIISYIEEHGYSPSYREICNMTRIKSTSSIQYHISKMLESGMLETDCGIGAARALRVPGYKFVKIEKKNN